MENEGKEKLVDLPEGTTERLKKEKKMAFVSWKDNCVYAVPRASGGKKMTDEEYKARQTENTKKLARRKEIRSAITGLGRKMAKAGKAGDAEKVKELSARVDELQKEHDNLKPVPLPPRKKKE